MNGLLGAVAVYLLCLGKEEADALVYRYRVYLKNLHKTVFPILKNMILTALKFIYIISLLRRIRLQ